MVGDQHCLPPPYHRPSMSCEHNSLETTSFCCSVRAEQCTVLKNTPTNFTVTMPLSYSLILRHLHKQLRQPISRLHLQSVTYLSLFSRRVAGSGGGMGYCPIAISIRDSPRLQISDLMLYRVPSNLSG